MKFLLPTNNRDFLIVITVLLTIADIVASFNFNVAVSSLQSKITNNPFPLEDASTGTRRRRGSMTTTQKAFTTTTPFSSSDIEVASDHYNDNHDNDDKDDCVVEFHGTAKSQIIIPKPLQEISFDEDSSILTLPDFLQSDDSTSVFLGTKNYHKHEINDDDDECGKMELYDCLQPVISWPCIRPGGMMKFQPIFVNQLERSNQQHSNNEKGLLLSQTTVTIVDARTDIIDNSKSSSSRSSSSSSSNPSIDLITKVMKKCNFSGKSTLSCYDSTNDDDGWKLSLNLQLSLRITLPPSKKRLLQKPHPIVTKIGSKLFSQICMKRTNQALDEFQKSYKEWAATTATARTNSLENAASSTETTVGTNESVATSVGNIPRDGVTGLSFFPLPTKRSRQMNEKIMAQEKACYSDSQFQSSRRRQRSQRQNYHPIRRPLSWMRQNFIPNLAILY